MIASIDPKRQNILAAISSCLSQHHRTFPGPFSFEFFEDSRHLDNKRLRQKVWLTTLAAQYCFLDANNLTPADIDFILFEVTKVPGNIQYIWSFNGYLNNRVPIHLFGPGLKKTMQDPPRFVYVNADPAYWVFTRIKQIQIRHFRAIERYIASLIDADQRDEASAILNLAAAFDNLFQPKGGNGKKAFRKQITSHLYKDKTLGAWATSFYQLRSNITHGSPYSIFPRGAVSSRWIAGDSIAWRHPIGRPEYVSHVFLGLNIFKLCLESQLNPQRKGLLSSLHQYHVKDKLNKLLIPNEVIYGKLLDLRIKGQPIGNEDYELIDKLSRGDSTGKKSTIKKLLVYFLDEIQTKWPQADKKAKACMKAVPNGNVIELAILVDKLAVFFWHDILNDPKFDRHAHSIVEFLDVCSYSLTIIE